MYGSPPSKRQTLCPAARSARTRLRTWTISEKPTDSNRRAGPGMRSFMARSDRVSDLLRDRLGLGEEVEVLAPAGLRIRARHVEAAEGVHADERARALAVQVEVSAEELALAALEPLRGRASRASPSGRTPCRWRPRSPSSKLLTGITASTGPKISSCARRSARLDVVDDRRLHEEPVRRARARRRRRPCPSFRPTSTYSRIFFCARSLMTAPTCVVRVADVADLELPSSSRRPSRGARRGPSRARSAASTRSTSAPGSRTRRRRRPWPPPRGRPSRRRG